MLHHFRKVFLIGVLVAACVPAVLHCAAHNLALDFIPRGILSRAANSAKWETKYKFNPNCLSTQQQGRKDACEQELARTFINSAGPVCARNSHIIALFPQEGPTLSVSLTLIAAAIDDHSRICDVAGEYKIKWELKPLRTPVEEAEYAYAKNKIVDCIKVMMAGLREITLDHAEHFDAAVGEAIAQMNIDMHMNLVHDAPPAYSDVPVLPASGRPQTPPPAYQ